MSPEAMEQDKATSSRSFPPPSSYFHLDQEQRCQETPPRGGSSHIENIHMGSQDSSKGFEVVKPYAIEEPDEGKPPNASHHPALLLPFQDNIGVWQRDLVDSMESLHCDSDNSDSHPYTNSIPRRGKKRKPTTNPSEFSRQAQLPPPKSLFDIHNQGPALSPKRQRKRSQRSRETLTTAHTLNRNERLSGSSEGSSSTDTSTANPSSGSTASDEMEID